MWRRTAEMRTAGTRSDKRRRSREKAVGVAVLLGLAACWEILAHAYHSEENTGSPLIPSWEYIATTGFKGLSNYWDGGWGVESPQTGGTETYVGALLATASNSLATVVHLLGGLTLGIIAGTLLGLAVSWSSWSRALVALPAHILRTLPLLAMIPLFQVWFGLSYVGILIFVAYGIGVIMFAATVNAVQNVPRLFTDNARTLGAKRARIYLSVIGPCIFPELRTAIILSLGLSWSVVLGAEFLGAQTGLGFIVVQAQQFALIDRMTAVSVVLVVYAALSYVVLERLSRRLIVWKR